MDQGQWQGEWPSLHLHDAQDTQHVLRGPYITWTGWKYVEFAVPAGVQYPVRVRRFYVAETNPAAQYTSEIVIDDLVAKVSPTVQAPPEEPRTDRVVLRDGTVDGATWRFAVLSDAQFVAADPDSDLVAQARRTLREVKAAKPDFLIIDGDFVDTAYPADFALAKRILDEELGGELPFYYVPGNHEIMGAPITNFTAVFGDTSRAFDHGGTRFVTLNTSTGSLRGSGFDQVKLLRDTLDAAAADPAVGSVAVLFHHPPRDPTPAKASQLGDRKEAALVEQWLADFQHRTGKGALMVNGHVGTFHADRVDGVPYVINGNSGKNPSTPPQLGGFTGWTEFGVDPVTPQEAERARRDPLAEGPRWVDAEIHAHVDRLALAAPASVAVGDPAAVTATLTQPGGRTVPVAAPVSADWSGSPNLLIGSADGVKPWHVARFDPATGRLTALRPGAQVLLAVTVNGVRAEATVVLTAAAPGRLPPPDDRTPGLGNAPCPGVRPPPADGLLPGEEPVGAPSEVALGDLEHGQVERPPHPDHLHPVVEDADHPVPVPDLPLVDLLLDDRVLALVADRPQVQRQVGDLDVPGQPGLRVGPRRGVPARAEDHPVAGRVHRPHRRDHRLVRRVLTHPGHVVRAAGDVQRHRAVDVHQHDRRRLGVRWVDRGRRARAGRRHRQR